MPLRVEHGSANDASSLLRLFDDAIDWLVERGQTEQWGSEPFSDDPGKVERVEGWAAGGGLWFAVDEHGRRAGAIVVGDHHHYISPPDRPELYVVVLLTGAAWRGQGVGARLIAEAERLARAQNAEQLRVDCWAGAPELAAAYERLGFERTGSFEVKGWPGAILTRTLSCVPAP